MGIQDLLLNTPGVQTRSTLESLLLCQVLGPDSLNTPGWAFLDFNSDGSPVTWTAGVPLPVYVAADGATLALLDMTRRLTREMASMTGIPFSFAGCSTMGPTDITTLRERAVLIAMVPTVMDLGSPTPAVATTQTWLDTPASGWRTRSRGIIKIAASADLLPGLVLRGIGPVLRHEMGHLVGLAHCADPNQVMFPGSYGRIINWGHGDSAGLCHIARTVRSMTTFTTQLARAS